jgi:translin
MALDQSDFAKIRKNLSEFDDRREKLIQDSRKVLKLSKQIIYSIHRNELDEAEKLIASIKKEVEKLPEDNYDTGMKNVALQEYAEAILFYEFVKSNKIPVLTELKISTAHYLLGMCDFTGELVRMTANLVLKEKVEDAKAIRQLVDDIYGEFLKFDLRNGELRRKSDSIKHNLRRIEDILYDAGIRKKT